MSGESFVESFRKRLIADGPSILKQIKENTAKRKSCTGPHQCIRIEKMPGRYKCQKCDVEVDAGYLTGYMECIESLERIFLVWHKDNNSDSAREFIDWLKKQEIVNE